jgi:hypothetical protein
MLAGPEQTRLLAEFEKDEESSPYHHEEGMSF